MSKKRSRVTKVDWAKYSKIIEDFVEVDAGTQKFLWLRKVNQPFLYGEDPKTVFELVQLEGLFQYNYIKTWPSNGANIVGEIDTSNSVLYITANILRDNGFINEYNYWNFNWSEDRFIINGKLYKPDGDTQVAQAGDKPLLYFLILQREDVQEQETVFNSEVLKASILRDHTLVEDVEFQGKKIKEFLKQI